MRRRRTRRSVLLLGWVVLHHLHSLQKWLSFPVSRRQSTHWAQLLQYPRTHRVLSWSSQTRGLPCRPPHPVSWWLPATEATAPGMMLESSRCPSAPFRCTLHKLMMLASVLRWGTLLCFFDISFDYLWRPAVALLYWSCRGHWGYK